MAKVKTFTFQDLEKKSVKIDLYFEVDSNSLYFYLDQVPKEVLKYCADKPITTTLKRREAVYVKDAKEAEKLITEIFNLAELTYRSGNKTKVIFYKFEVEGKIGDSMESDYSYGSNPKDDNFSHRVLGFSWGICYALKGNKNSIVYLNEDGSTNANLKYHANGSKVINWSEEKELFFKSLDIAYEKLSEKMRTFRDTEKEDFDKLIQSSGMKLLPEIK